MRGASWEEGGGFEEFVSESVRLSKPLNLRTI
jgi:hypothetical protein